MTEARARPLDTRNPVRWAHTRQPPWFLLIEDDSGQTQRHDYTTYRNALPLEPASPDHPAHDALAGLFDLEHHRSALLVVQCTANLLANAGQAGQDGTKKQAWLAGNSRGPLCVALSAGDPRPMVGIGPAGTEGNWNGELNQETCFVRLHWAEEKLDSFVHDNDAILLHELGHLLMMRVLGPESLDDFSPRPCSASRMHLTTTITDRVTAFHEGWANALQCLALERSPLAGEEDRGLTFDPSPAAHWLCTAENRRRYAGIKRNLFVYHASDPPAEAIQDLSPYQTIVWDSTSAVPDEPRLKEPGQLVANEGWIATLFFYLLTDPTLCGSYSPMEYYLDFLPPEVRDDPQMQDLHPRELFSPLENQMLKILKTAYRHLGLGKQVRDHQTRPWVIPLLEGYCTDHPRESESATRLLFELSCFTLACPEAEDLWREIHTAGRLGHIPSLRRLMVEWQQMAERAVARVMVERKLDTRLGPEIWLANPHVQVPPAYWVDAPLSPLTFDLNACRLADLLTVFGLTPELGRTIIRERRARGYFSSLDDVHPMLPHSVFLALLEMHRT